MKNFLILLVIITALFSSCSFEKRALKRGYIPIGSVSDSTIIIDSSYIDTLIIPGDSAILKLYLACDSTGQVYIKAMQEYKGKLIELEQELLNNILSTRVVYMDREVLVPGKDRIVEHYVDKPYPVVTNKVPKVVKFLAWTGGISWLLLILYVLYRIFVRKNLKVFSKLR